MDKKTIGNCIRFHRQKKGLTQAELAEKVAVSENLIGYYERGITAPGRETLFKLSVVLDFSIDAQGQRILAGRRLPGRNNKASRSAIRFAAQDSADRIKSHGGGNA